MYLVKKSRVFFIFTAVLLISTFALKARTIYAAANKAEVTEIVKQIFISKSKAILEQDLESIASIYDRNRKVGQWAFEHEAKKIKYIKNWSEKQSVTFTNITPTIQVKSVKVEGDNYSVYLICSTEYKYSYEDRKDVENTFRIGTYHIMTIKNVDGAWIVTKEWYTDPFADSLNLDSIKADSIREYILSQQPRDFSNLLQRRLDAVNYADKYSGAANEEQNGFTYNKKYKNLNPQGGDCANFASQILFEGAKFKKNRVWNYEKDGTKAWANAHGFKDYWVGSKRASVIAHGNYNQVFKASYKLLPGDFIAYEKGGRITHISVVTGADSRGYTLVNCHNSDRHRVPWDLGWSNTNIKFHFVRVHF